jgi:ABC-2 type transport system ATP-binding protein
MIEVEHLTKYYGQVAAIDDVSFTVDRGEILGFLGPNGAGKTTTMRILTCFIPATSGTARIAGFDVFSDSLEVRRRIGYLPERLPLYKDVTVDDYLDFVARLKGVSARGRREKVDEVKDDCGISEISNRLVGKLSKGYTQRVGIAQALLGDPEVLVLDEPTVGLDPKQIVEIRNLVRNLAGKKTIILSTHILPEVDMICDSVAIINEGRIVARDAIGHLGADPRLKVRLTVKDSPGRGAETMVSTLLAVEGVEEARVVQETADASPDAAPGGTRIEVIAESGADPRAAVAAAVVGNGWQLIELRPERSSLEDIFIRATAKEIEVGR